MKEAADLLREGLRELGLGLNEFQIASFLTYLSELRKWNRTYSLTGLKSASDIVIKHFLDSLLFRKVLPPEVRSLADVGSGAGFPGIPLKIADPALEVYLVEPTQKKAVFLRHVCSRLGLEGIEVINRRLEEVEGLKVDAAVTRALFSVGDFLKKAAGILNEGGILALSKGPKVDEELKGVEPGRIILTDLRLPLSGITRRLVVVKP
ncbi:MAG: 16S rRNA (guanine(527)-N(7))-methyltransferase RsmG [Candidatus Sulfobium sp.]|jgi:16S rRNA (guanine527-N7)-methyltransferase